MVSGHGMLSKSILFVVTATRRRGDSVMLSRTHAIAAAHTIALLIQEDPQILCLPRRDKTCTHRMYNLQLPTREELTPAVKSIAIRQERLLLVISLCLLYLRAKPNESCYSLESERWQCTNGGVL